MRYPLDQVEITDHYGMRVHPITGDRRMHRGTDFAAGYGAPIRAIGPGVIVGRGYSPSGAGHWVELALDHTPGLVADHFHMAEPAWVQRGQRVAEGDTLGIVGSTGASTGPHLHLELRWHGQHLDPWPWLQAAIHTPTTEEDDMFTETDRANLQALADGSKPLAPGYPFPHVAAQQGNLEAIVTEQRRQAALLAAIAQNLGITPSEQ